MKGRPVKEIKKNLVIKVGEKLERIISQERSGVVVPSKGFELKCGWPF